MREFMDYILEGFSEATGWNRDNTYADLNKTANGGCSPLQTVPILPTWTRKLTSTSTELLNFPIPGGLRLNLSSLATPQFATSYTFGAVGVVDGSLSYLYSSVPLRSIVAQSDKIPLPTLLRSYRPLRELQPELFPPQGNRPTLLSSWPTALPSLEDTQDAVVKKARRLVERPTLFYGRLFLPRSLLEALVVKRISPSTQVQVNAVSEAQLRNGGTVLGMVQVDKQQYGIEGLASSDGGLLGLRGLYNFGGDASPRTEDAKVLDPATGVAKETASSADKERMYGRFSVGGEVYYGTLNKSGGVSLGARFATLPTYRDTPLTATMTINPLMGTLSWTYALQARRSCSLATKFDFNVYSYESDWAVGMELWSKRRLAGLVAGDPEDAPPPSTPDQDQQPTGESAQRRHRSFKAKMEWRLDDPEEIPGLPDPREWTGSATPASEDEAYHGVLKARLDQNLRIGLLWEGRMKSLLFSLGTAVDMHKLNQPFRKLGLEIQFSS